MSTAGSVALFLLFGLAVGVVFTVIVRGAADRGAAALDLLQQNAPDGVAVVLAALDRPALLLDGSNAVLIGTPAADALGLVEGRLLISPELNALVDEVRAGHEAGSGEYQLRRGAVGPAVLPVFARAAPVGISWVLLLVEDRSDPHRLEAVRRDFVANVSHELKTPIGAVGLLAEALTSAADDPDQVRRFAARLTAEADRLAALTQDIIDFSRIQSGDALHQATTVDVDDVLVAATERSEVAAEAKSVAIVLGKRSKLHVLGNTALLTTAVQNLVANAVQHSPVHGHVGIAARAREGVVEISVSDQGPGISEEDLERVFERFYRGDPARSRSTGGTGLGLSIVKHITENHGGEVRVWSRIGEGSTFTIRLPEAPAPDGSQSRRREKERV